jgi:tetratricopeptide (TPR) repeat protein
MSFTRSVLVVWGFTVCLGLALLSGCAGVAEKPVAQKKESVAYRKNIHSTLTPFSQLNDRDKQNFKSALDAMKDNQNNEAIGLLKAVVSEYPNFVGGLLNLGVAYYKQGRPAEAKETLEKVIALDNTNTTAYNYLGILFRNEGRFKDAKQAYEQALEIDPDYAYAHLNLGILYDLYLLDAPKALKNYQRYQELTPEEDKQVMKWIVDLKRRSK